jgi:hypothetical protein
MTHVPSFVRVSFFKMVRIQHRFSAAALSLSVDDKVACDRPLRGQIKKDWNPFRMEVRETESLRLAAGKHR